MRGSAESLKELYVPRSAGAVLVNVSGPLGVKLTPRYHKARRDKLQIAEI
jgi:hypothetical protein